MKPILAAENLQFWLRCRTEKEAVRVTKGIAQLRSALTRYLKEKPVRVSAPLRNKDLLLIHQNDYTPWVLERWRGRVADAHVSSLSFPAALGQVLAGFEAVFGSAQIVCLEPVADVRWHGGVTVATSPAAGRERLEQLHRAHRKLLKFAIAWNKLIGASPCTVVNIEQAEKGLTVRSNGNAVETTMAQDRALATLVLVGPEEFEAKTFCQIYSGDGVVEPDSYFDTAVRQLRQVLPTVAWKSEYGGKRRLIGLRIETRMKSAELRAFVESNRQARKPRRKKAKSAKSKSGKKAKKRRDPKPDKSKKTKK